MARVMFIGDPHLKITRFDLAKQFLVWLNSLIEETKPDIVVNLGDTFDTHSVVRSEIMTEFMKHVDFVRSKVPYVYLLGNHDMYKPNDSKYHALTHLIGKLDNFHVVDKLEDLYGMTFVPYIVDPNKFPTQTLPICVAHQTFKGADFGDITTKDGVDAFSIQGADIIISGHIHKRQRLDNSAVSTQRATVLYVGSPFAQSSSDINQIKGITIFDTGTYKEEFYECPLPRWKGLRYEVSPSFSLEDLHEDLQNQINDKDHWVVEITGPKTEILGYIDSKKAKQLFSGKDIKIKPVFTDKEKRQIRIEAVSLDSIISQYIDKVYSGNLDKEELKNKALEVLSKLNSGSSLV